MRGVFLAHSANKAGKTESLKEHLEAVSTRAAEYAAPFGASDEARLAGLLHDLGKYGALFQARLEGREHGIDHWSAGAWAALSALKWNGIASALSIQGHHIGLQWADKDELRNMQYATSGRGLRLSEDNADRLRQRYTADGFDLANPNTIKSSIYDGISAPKKAASMLDVRMLFSALVDADFIETEAHFQSNADGSKRYREEGAPLEPHRWLLTLLSYLEGVAAASEAADAVKRLRQDLLAACLDRAESPQGVFTLTAPTGAGKTLSMLAFALKHAAKHGLRRVIIVVPYLTIIDQTARQYREVFARDLSDGDLGRFLLEHHSLAFSRAEDPPMGKDADMEDESRRRARLLAENWDAPIVLTTSVQMLESLFSNRPSGCRKLHRIARSVILFDEFQTLPLGLAVPTLATLSRLAERYGSTVVVATATQPAFGHIDAEVKKHCARGWTPTEVVPPESNLFARARRVTVEWPDGSAPTAWAALAERLAAQPQVLCVVNMKRHAAFLYDELAKSQPEALFHLSTSMCPAHRVAVMDEVRTRLDHGMPCRLISTQCVEAGVDIDFPVVFRAWGPLDSIAQAAGRCNRNGRAPLGTVYLFVPEEAQYPDASYRQATDVTMILFKGRGPSAMDINDPALFEAYYKELYDVAKPADRKRELGEAIGIQDFASVAKLYRVIEQDAVNVLMPYCACKFATLEEEVLREGLTAKWIAKARPLAVSLFRPKRDDPVTQYLEAVPAGRGGSSDEWFLYRNAKHYHPKRGFVPPLSWDLLVG